MPAAKPSDPQAVEFGRYLKALREARGLTLRQVEQITNAKISNGYLSQLENAQVKRPSGVVLHTLAAAYGIDQAALLARAGLVPEPAAPSRLGSVLGEVTPDEEAELLRYLAYIRQR